MDRLSRQYARIAKLPHDKNDFLSVAYWFSEYPEVESAVFSQAEAAGFGFPDVTKHTDTPIRPRRFELQTHQRSVEKHLDDVARSYYFGLLPVARRVRVRGPFETGTLLHFGLGGQKLYRRLEIGSLIVFNPRVWHELVYYGEETTFMLFTLVRKRIETC